MRLFLPFLLGASLLATQAAAVPYVKTLAGYLSNGGYEDGIGTDIRLNRPTAIARDKYGNLYVAEAGNHIVRKLHNYGGGLYGSSLCAGHPGHPGQSAGLLSGPSAVVVDPITNDGSKVYITSGHAIVVANCFGDVGFLTGEVYGAVGTPGYINATGGGVGCLGNGSPSARFNDPTGLAFDPVGATLYVSDSGNHRIRSIRPATCAVQSFAGSGAAGYANGAPGSARFNGPRGLVYAKLPSGTENFLFVADTGNDSLRAIRLRMSGPNTIGDVSVETAVGSPGQGPGHGDARYLPADGRWFSQGTASGPVDVEFIENPYNMTGATPPTVAVVFNSGNNLRFIDLPNKVFQGQNPNRVPHLYTLVRSSSGFSNGPLDMTPPKRFWGPHGIVALANGRLAVADVYNNQIRTVSVTSWLDQNLATSIDALPPNTPHLSQGAGTIVSSAGWQPTYYTAQGAPGGGTFWSARGVAVDDNTGDIYVVDGSGARIHRFTSNGVGSLVVPSLSGAISIAVLADSGGVSTALVGMSNGTVRRYAINGGALTFIDATSMGTTSPIWAIAARRLANETKVGWIAVRSDNYLRAFDPVTMSLGPIVGTPGTAGYVDTVPAPGVVAAVGAIAQFSSPSGVAINPFDGSALVVDTSNDAVREIFLNGNTLAVRTRFGTGTGTGSFAYACPASLTTPVIGFGNNCGALRGPTAIAIGRAGSQLYAYVINQPNASILRYKLNDFILGPGVRTLGDVALQQDEDGLLPLYTGTPWSTMPDPATIRGRFDFPLALAASPGSDRVYVGNNSSLRVIYEPNALDEKPTFEAKEEELKSMDPRIDDGATAEPDELPPLPEKPEPVIGKDHGRAAGNGPDGDGPPGHDE